MSAGARADGPPRHYGVYPAIVTDIVDPLAIGARWQLDGPEVFRDVSRSLWEACDHNPRKLLDETVARLFAQAGHGSFSNPTGTSSSFATTKAARSAAGRSRAAWNTASVRCQRSVVMPLTAHLTLQPGPGEAPIAHHRRG
mgnify:CR=1 FL=1